MRSSGTGGFGAGIAIDRIAPDESLMTRESITSETILEVSNNPLVPTTIPMLIPLRMAQHPNRLQP
jgi:hypothetical protein